MLAGVGDHNYEQTVTTMMGLKAWCLSHGRMGGAVNTEQLVCPATTEMSTKFPKSILQQIVVHSRADIILHCCIAIARNNPTFAVLGSKSINIKLIKTSLNSCHI